MEADRLLKSVKARSDGHIPLFTSDDLDQYETAILKAYGINQEIPRTGRRGKAKICKARSTGGTDVLQAYQAPEEG